jgi:glycerophosphoryl diester phosphodiesterase
MALVAAHRGASSLAPENTIEAFEKAIEIGAEMIEFDVRSTRDGVLVAFHDEVRDWTYTELCERLPWAPPRLEQVVDVCAGRIVLDVELKEGGYVDQALRVVSRAELIVTSFLPEVVAEAKLLRPDFRVGLLLAAGADVPAAADADFLAPHYSLLDHGLVGEQHDGLVVWTVNDEERLARYLVNPRVSVVISDDPVLALEVRARSDRGDAET